jgi:hypothetical protein
LKESDGAHTPPELPEARPLPHEANPGGTEGADSAWTGGESNLGDLLNPEPDWDTTYSTKQAGGAGRRESVRGFLCDKCSQVFDSEADLESHQQGSHRPCE